MLGAFSPAIYWQGALEQRLKRCISSTIRISRPQEAMRRVMAQVDTTQLPNKLVDIHVAAQMPAIHGFLNQSLEHAAPFTFHLKNLIPDRALHIVEFEQSSRHGTASRKPGSLRPTEPLAHQRLEPRETFVRLHCRFHNLRRGESPHVLE